jgi:endonuclease-3
VSSRSSGSLAAQSPAARLRSILRRLNRSYGRPSHGREGDPLDSLSATVRSQNTTDVNSGRAFSQLKARFPDWEQVLSARAERIAGAIRSGGLGDIKARRIKRILRQIEQDRGRLDLGFLRRLPLPEARDYLTGLPGVGPKTAACVLLFSLRRAAFPVDTHVLRVSRRLAIIPPTTTMEQAHDIYDALLTSDSSRRSKVAWEAQAMLALHLGLVRHGREICAARRPRCDSCPLSELCPRVGVTGAARGDTKR